MEVYLDDGRLYTPPTLTIPTLPPSTVEPLHWALARVLNPGIEFRDHLFGTGTQKLEVKSMELQVLCLCTCVYSPPPSLPPFLPPSLSPSLPPSLPLLLSFCLSLSFSLSLSLSGSHTLLPSPSLSPSLSHSKDKEVRTIFLCFLVTLLGNCQQFVTVLRFHPTPSFAFNKVSYVT